jgi:molybdopterin-guanine dinucleotide biosynthesis protein A
LPTAGGHNHPLAAVYRVSLLSAVEELLAADRLRPFFLFESVRTLVFPEGEISETRSLRNLNTFDEYSAALAESEPQIEIAIVGPLRRTLGFHETSVRASTLGAALAALPGFDPAAPQAVIALNGKRFQNDPRAPLVTRDRLVLATADTRG